MEGTKQNNLAGRIKHDVPMGLHDGLRDEVLRDFTTLLSGSQLQKAKPAEWFLHAKTLIDRAKTATPREREKLIPLIYNSRSTILHLYVQKEELLKSAN